MKKLGIDRSTDLSYSNNRSRELRPDQSQVQYFLLGAPSPSEIWAALGLLLEEAGFKRGTFQGFTYVSNKRVK